MNALTTASSHVGPAKPTREFLNVEDAVEGILNATEEYDRSEPVNLVSYIEINIRKLTRIISDVTVCEGEVNWDPSKPDCQMRRCIDISRAKRYFDWEAMTDFETGGTVEWFENKFEYV